MKLLLLMMCYYVPVSLCIHYEVSPVGIVTERGFVCSMVANANVAAALHETTATECKLID